MTQRLLYSNAGKRFARKRALYASYQIFVNELGKRIDCALPGSDVKKYRIHDLDEETNRIFHLYEKSFISDEIWAAEKLREPKIYLSEKRVKKAIKESLQQIIKRNYKVTLAL